MEKPSHHHNNSSAHSSPKVTKQGANKILTIDAQSGGFSQGHDDEDKNLYDNEANSVQRRSCLVEGQHALCWKIQDKILNCIGQTLIIKLNRIPGLTKGVNIYQVGESESWRILAEKLPGNGHH